MKRLADYNLTEQEIRQIFGSQEGYERHLGWYEKNPGSIDEICDIACVLFHRGKKEESRKMLESIEDEREREICLRDHYGSWCAWEEGCM